MYKELIAELRDYDGPVIYEDADGQHVERTAVDITERAAEAIERLLSELERVKRERDAAMDAIGRMAEYIVTYGRVDEMLCDDIPRELHLKYQPLDDGNYDNEPCIECVREYFMRREENQDG